MNSEWQCIVWWICAKIITYNLYIIQFRRSIDEVIGYLQVLMYMIRFMMTQRRRVPMFSPFKHWAKYKLYRVTNYRIRISRDVYKLL